MIRLPILMQIYIFMHTAKEIPLKQFLVYCTKIPNLTSNERCPTNFKINAKTPISLQNQTQREFYEREIDRRSANLETTGFL